MNRRQLIQEGFWRGVGGIPSGLAIGLLIALVINVTAILKSTSSDEAPAPIGQFQIGKSSIR
jgi:hypothetical protein